MASETLRGTACYILVIAEALRLAERPDALMTRAEIDAAAEQWVNRPGSRWTTAPTFIPWALRSTSC